MLFGWFIYTYSSSSSSFPQLQFIYRTRGNPFSAVDWARLLKDGANNQTTNKRSATAAAVWLLYICARDRELPGRRADLSIQQGQERKKRPWDLSLVLYIYVDSLIELRYTRV